MILCCKSWRQRSSTRSHVAYSNARWPDLTLHHRDWLRSIATGNFPIIYQSGYSWRYFALHCNASFNTQNGTRLATALLNYPYFPDYEPNLNHRRFSRFCFQNRRFIHHFQTFKVASQPKANFGGYRCRRLRRHHHHRHHQHQLW